MFMRSSFIRRQNSAAEIIPQTCTSVITHVSTKLINEVPVIPQHSNNEQFCCQQVIQIVKRQLHHKDGMTTTPQPFYSPLSGTTQVSQCQKITSVFYGAGKINRGRHTDHLTGRHSIRTNQCPPPPSLHFLQAGCPSCRPTNSVKALKAMQTINTDCWDCSLS